MRTGLYTLAIVLATTAVINACKFPPSVWCSSPDIAKSCGVEKQCSFWQSKKGVTDAPPVQLELYYESLCPDCRQYIQNQLWPTWQKIGDSGILNLTLVPYGNAQEQQYGDQWYFTCQHGAAECLGNLIETCALNFYAMPKAFPFIYCLEYYGPTLTNAEYCASLHSVDYSKIETCTQSKAGNEMEHQMAVKTDALNPPHQYVPWLVLNGVHTEQIQNEVTSNTLGVVCDTYTGPKPAGCTTLPKACSRE
ncbi:gamma-interferon-inducible lysosomal thiol reductase-like [Diadema antillarum]|uniref:gamma-interferon-inducible lysosomal thiol reductase-like n=1 Tax=Diadema antillarum TaxID=105358 RepID=UPI003A8B50EB